MNWIRVNEHHYVNEAQLRDIQFIKKGTNEYFYRLFYANGSSVDIKGFTSLEDTYEAADRTFGLTKAYSAPEIVENVTPAKKVRVKVKK